MRFFRCHSVKQDGVTVDSPVQLDLRVGRWRRPTLLLFALLLDVGHLDVVAVRRCGCIRRGGRGFLLLLRQLGKQALLLLRRLGCKVCRLLLVVLAQVDAQTGTGEIERDARVEFEAAEQVDDRGDECRKLIRRCDRLKQLIELEEDGVVLRRPMDQPTTRLDCRATKDPPGREGRRAT